MEYTEGIETFIPGRSASLFVRGSSADELEMKALDTARQIFGPDVRLSLVRDYLVSEPGGYPPAGEKFMSSITVRVIEPPE